MDCAEIERVLIAGPTPTGPDVEAHLAECPACRYLVAEGAGIAPALANDGSSDDAASPAAIERAVMDRLAHERGVLARLRETPRPFRIGLVVALVALEAAYMFIHVRRSDWATYPSWRMTVTVCAYALGMVLLLWIALRPLYRPPLAARVETALLAIAVGLPFLIALLPAEPTVPNSFFTYPRFTFRCFAYGSCLALPVILLHRIVDRGNGMGLWATATAVVAAGYVGLFGLQLECPINLPLHLVTGHATVPLGLVLGYWVIRKT